MDAGYKAALAELTGSLLEDSDLPTLMYRVVTFVADTLMVKHSTLWELRPDGSALVLRAAVGGQEDAVGVAMAASGARSALGTAVLGTRLVLVADWRNETRFDRPSLLRDCDVISSLYVAIQGQHRPFGVLCVDTATRRIFSDQEIYLLQVVANVLALAIERVTARQTLEQQIEHARLVTAAQDQAVLEERQRLARELHDSVTQALYGVTLHAGAATRLLESGDVATTAENLRVLQETAQEALDEMRLLIFELRPPVLEQVGLAAALQARLNSVEGRANLETRLIVDGVGDLPLLVQEALYRITQEALNNTLKHAHAGCITVQLRQVQSRVILEIIDDGVGFNPAAAQETGGLGLRGIAERVAQLNGTLTLQSAPQDGSLLRVEIAL
ncbi:MAG TPA: GAF domain-containing sensor histidine kinase [Herpetosiphonaceae bacterium]